MIIRRLGQFLIEFQLKRPYLTDNRYLFVPPSENFCRACFQRRYLSQMANCAEQEKLERDTLGLARRLDDRPRGGNGRWEAHMIGRPASWTAFDVMSYEDCPVCGSSKSIDQDTARSVYERLLNEKTVPDLEGLKKQVFSFGFARGNSTTREAGLGNPALDKLMGGNYESRIAFRMVASDGRFSEDSAVGMAQDRGMAEIKALMEYIERYAFMLQICRYRTKEYDDDLIARFLELYDKDISEAEMGYLREEACWGVDLVTGSASAIPLIFLFDKGKSSFIKPSSSGFAAHVDFAKSTCNSICELIERDAFIRFWYDPERAYAYEAGLDAKREVEEILGILKGITDNDNIESKFFVLPSPTKVPVVLTTLSSGDFSAPPSLCFGCGVGFGFDEAVAGAIKELRFNVLNLAKGVAFFKGFLDRRFGDKTGIRSMFDKMNFYSTCIPRSSLRFLDHCNTYVDGVVEEFDCAGLGALVDRFERAGFDIHVIDCTPSCFRDKNVYVTRAFSTRLYPMQFSADDAFALPTGPLSCRKEFPHFFV